jgi:signal transduction histidine kinase/CheY-like chemotaxis protein
VGRVAAYRAGVELSGDLQTIKRIADVLPVGVWVARAEDGSLVYANQTFAEIMGMAARDDVAVGEYAEPYGIYDREGNLYPEEKMPFVRALKAAAEVEVDDIVIHRSDGRKVYIRAFAKPLLDDDGAPEMILIAFTDMSREVEAERARANSEARARSAERLEAVGTLAGGIAHDFNNMLAVVRTLTELVADEPDEETRKRDLDSILEVTDGAVLLTQSLLSFSGRAPRKLEPLSLDDVVRGMAPILERVLHGRIAVHVACGSGRVVEGDRAQLEQVLMNLVVNARDAMPDGGELWLRVTSRGNEVCLEVEDTGSGIDRAHKERVFEPYFTTKDDGGGEGAGLGLATVWGIVEAHRGRVELKERDGGGTIVQVTLPALREPTAPAQQRPATRPVELVMGEGLVLVVDDIALVRAVYQRALKRLGYSVVTATNGLEALERFEELKDELVAVVLDLHMPHLDGIGALERMRAIDEQIPVLVTTGYAETDSRGRLQALGAAGFLPKPFDLHELSTQLSAAIQARESSA